MFSKRLLSRWFSSNSKTSSDLEILSLLPSVQRALLSSSGDLSSSLKLLSESSRVSLPSSTTTTSSSSLSPSSSKDLFLPEVLLPKLAAACTQGRGQGSVGQEFLRTALSPLCAVIPKMQDFSPLAAVAEAYTHVGDRVVLAKQRGGGGGKEERSFLGGEGGEEGGGTSSRLSEASKLILLRNVADQTLALLSSSTSAPTQLSVQQCDKLARILASLSRTSLFKPELYERSLPHITSLLSRMPRGPQALHTLSRTAGAFIRYNPSLEHLSSPLASRLVLELDFSRAELSKSLKRASIERSGARGGGGREEAINADEVRRRLQPAIGSLWYLALATRFGTDLKSDEAISGNKKSELKTDKRQQHHHIPSSLTTKLSIEERALQKGFEFINFAYESWEKQQEIEASKGNVLHQPLSRELSTFSSSSSSSSPPPPPPPFSSSHRTIRLNASDIGRLSALLLGAKATESPLQFSEALQIAINGWRRLKKDTANVKTSKLQIDVRSAIVSLCGTTKLPPPHVEFSTEEGLIVDFAWTFPNKQLLDHRTHPVNATHDDNKPVDKENKEEENEPKGVVLEVDGPAHFVLVENEEEEEEEIIAVDDVNNRGTREKRASNQVLSPSPSPSSMPVPNKTTLIRALDAPTRYKFWLLERFGWQVIHVPWTEWPRKGSLIEKTRYIAERMAESSRLSGTL